MAWLVLGLLIFHGIHSLRMVAPDWREARIASMGEGAWKGLYSLIAIGSLALIIWGYAEARYDAEILYIPPIWGRHLSWLIMVLAFIALMVAYIPAGMLKPVLKHPMLVSVKLWALAHLLANGDTASVLLFGSFLAWAIWNRIAVKRRGDPVPARGPIVNDVLAVVIGMALWTLFVYWAHEFLFGIAPM